MFTQVTLAPSELASDIPNSPAVIESSLPLTGINTLWISLSLNLSVRHITMDLIDVLRKAEPGHEVFMVDVATAPASKTGTLFVGAGAPQNLRDRFSREIVFSLGLDAARGELLGYFGFNGVAEQGDLGVFDERDVNDAPEAWNQMLEAHKLPGIKMNSGVYQTIQGLPLRELNAFLAAVRATGGLVDILGVRFKEIDGQRKLFLFV